jgi:hypothetical protein
LLSNPQIAEQAADWIRPRTQDEPDYYQIVLDLLIKLNAPSELIDDFTNDPMIAQIKQANSLIQRQIISRYWYHYLLYKSIQGTDTISERYLLSYSDDDQIWLDLLEREVLPFAMKIAKE